MSGRPGTGNLGFRAVRNGKSGVPGGPDREFREIGGPGGPDREFREIGSGTPRNGKSGVPDGPDREFREIGSGTPRNVKSGVPGQVWPSFGGPARFWVPGSKFGQSWGSDQIPGSGVDPGCPDTEFREIWSDTPRISM